MDTETYSGNMESHLVVGRELMLEIVKLTPIHSLSSRKQHLQRGWTIFCSSEACSNWWKAGLGLFVSPHLSGQVLEFTPVDEYCIPPGFLSFSGEAG